MKTHKTQRVQTLQKMVNYCTTITLTTKPP